MREYSSERACGMWGAGAEEDLMLVQKGEWSN